MTKPTPSEAIRKTRKKANRISRSCEPVRPLVANSAEFTEMVFSDSDIELLRDKIKNPLKLKQTDYRELAHSFTYSVNKFVQEWILQQQNTNSDFIKWSEDIQSSAAQLLACLGVNPLQEAWLHMPPETAIHLISPYTFDSFALLGDSQRQVKITGDVVDIIEQAGAYIFMLHKIAAETASKFKKQKTPLDKRHKKDAATHYLFAQINNLYKSLSGKSSNASNGDGKGLNTAKGNSMEFIKAIIAKIIDQIKEGKTEKFFAIQEGVNGERALCANLTKMLTKETGNALIASYVHKGKKHPSYKR